MVMDKLPNLVSLVEKRCYLKQRLLLDRRGSLLASFSEEIHDSLNEFDGSLQLIEIMHHKRLLARQSKLESSLV